MKSVTINVLDEAVTLTGDYTPKFKGDYLTAPSGPYFEISHIECDNLLGLISNLNLIRKDYDFLRYFEERALEALDDEENWF